MPVRVIDTIRPRGNFPVVVTDNIGGQFVKGINANGELVLQQADGTEARQAITGYSTHQVGTEATYPPGFLVVEGTNIYVRTGAAVTTSATLAGADGWVSLVGGNSILNHRTGGLIPPASDGSDDNKLALTNSGVYYVEVTPHPQTPAEAAWSSFTRDGYIGAHREDQVRDPQSANENYYDITHQSWRSAVLRNPLLGDYRWVSGSAPGGWIGHFHSRDLALRQAPRTVGEGFIAFTGVLVERGTVTVVATNSHTTRAWVRTNISDIGVLEALIRALSTQATAAEITSIKTVLAYTLLQLPGTPNAFVANRYWRTNGAGDAVEQVPEPTQRQSVLPVGHIPTTNIAAVIYLTHDHYQGTRSDITVTTGFYVSSFENSAGYNRGNVDDERQFGATNRDVGPLEAIEGIGVAGDYRISILWSFNRHWLDSFTHIVLNNVEYPLTSSELLGGVFIRQFETQAPDLTEATFTLNFRRADNTYYYTQSATLVNRAGVYQWDPDTDRYDEGLFGAFPVISVGLGVRVGQIYRAGVRLYTPLSSFTVDAPRLPPHGASVGMNWEPLVGLRHYNGTAGPSSPPTAAGQSWVNDEGKLWVAGDRLTVEIGPVITSSSFGTDDFFKGFDLDGDQLATGEFTWITGFGAVTTTLLFRQERLVGGTAVTALHSWRDVWVYILTLAGQNTASHQALRDSVFLGSFHSDEEAAATISGRSDSATGNFYYILIGDGLRHVESYTANDSIFHDVFFWRGPLRVSDDEQIPFPPIVTGLAVNVGKIYRVGSTLYTPRSDFTVAAATLPPNGASVDANWLSLVAQSAFVYVQSLPAASAVPASNYGKIYAVGASNTGESAIFLLAHLKPTAAAVGEWSTGRDPGNYNRIGFTLDSYGQIVPALNITALYETPVGPTHHRLELHVAAEGTIPRANTGRSVYFREYNTSNQWRAVSVEGGADGTYLSEDYTSQFVQSGRRYEVIVRSQGAGLNNRQLVTDPPSDNRYDFYPNGVKWAILPDADELLHSNVMIQVLQGNLLLPRPTTGEAGFVPRVNTAENAYDLVDPTTLGTGTADAIARAAAATAQTAAEAAQVTANIAVTPGEALALVSDWAEEGNADPIPAGKLANAPGGGVGSFDGTITGLTEANNGQIFIYDHANTRIVPATPQIRGPLWASCSALSLTQRNNQTALAPPPTWTITDEGTAAGLTIGTSSGVNVPGPLVMPLELGLDTYGLILEGWLDGVYVPGSRAELIGGNAYASNSGNPMCWVRLTSTQWVQVRWQLNRADPVLILYGTGTVLPANATVRVYPLGRYFDAA